MEMVTGWTGHDASALQSALRMSHQAFASHLRIGLRTVADWHEKTRHAATAGDTADLGHCLAQAPAAVRQ